VLIGVGAMRRWRTRVELRTVDVLIYGEPFALAMFCTVLGNLGNWEITLRSPASITM
jgi:hypothetical protein